MSTQSERLLDYLRDNKSIDPLQAWSELGIYRLSARIKELRDRGVSISSDPKQVKNKFGEDCRVAKYTLNFPIVRKHYELP